MSRWDATIGSTAGGPGTGFTAASVASTLVLALPALVVPLGSSMTSGLLFWHPMLFVCLGWLSARQRSRESQGPVFNCGGRRRHLIRIPSSCLIWMQQSELTTNSCNTLPLAG